jgi:hypothetical protein
MTEVPSLREALRTTAERRYGHPVRRRVATAALATFATVTIVATGLFAFTIGSQRTGTPPEAEVEATGIPRAGSTMHVMRVRPIDDLGGGKPTATRAWSVPGLGGDVHLVQDHGRSCLSAPDPNTAKPQVERAVGCTGHARSERFGVSLTIGTSYLAVVADDVAAPLVRAPSGVEHTVRPTGGLVALADAPDGTVITRFDTEGRRSSETIRTFVPPSLAPACRSDIADGPGDPCPSHGSKSRG